MDAPNFPTDGRLRALVNAAREFHDVVRKKCWHVPEALDNDIEGDVEPVAAALFDAFGALEGEDLSGLPRRVGRGVAALRGAFGALIERWGWQEVIGPHRETYAARRREDHRLQREEPFLRHNMAWREPDGLRDHELADDLYNRAKSRGLQPAEIDPSRLEAETGRLWQKYRTEPILGDRLPYVDAADLVALSDAIRMVESGIPELPPENAPVARSPGVDPPEIGHRSEAEASEAGSEKRHNYMPFWDSLRYQLWYGDVLCLDGSRKASAQDRVLDKFQSEGWPESIVTPFNNDRQTRDTVDHLNGRLETGSPIRFRAGKGAQVIYWEPVGQDPGTRP